MKKISTLILEKFKTKLMIIKKKMEAKCPLPKNYLKYYSHKKKKNKVRFQQMKLKK
jgi:hypothetical protein